MRESTGRRLSRITAVLLTAAMLFSSLSFYDMTVWAETLPADESTTAEKDSGRADSDLKDNDPEDSALKDNGLKEDGLTGSEQNPAEAEEDGEEALDEEEYPVLRTQVADMTLTLAVVRKSGRELTLEWTGPKNITGAAQCWLYINGSKSAQISFGGSEEKLSYTCTGLKYSTEYSFSVTYLDGEGAEIISSEPLRTKSAVEPPKKRSLSSFVINSPSRLTWNGSPFNLRHYAGESHNGYSIVQGSCVDNKGEYSYYCMVDDSDYGKLVKIRMSDNSLVAVSGPQRLTHGAGMCYDSKRNRVVIATHDNYRRTLNFVDPNTLLIVERKDLNDAGIRSKLGNRNATGVSALAYNAKYDCYVGMQKTHHNIIIYDAETLNARAAAITEFGNAYPGVFQSVDADDTYMYFLLSKDEPSQPNNILVAFDWHAEKYEALLNGTSTEYMWYCGSGNGQPSAVITITGANEIESLYHTDAGGGKGHFYLVNYNNAPTNKTTVIAQKWKKVWKKIKKKVKWKKVWKKYKVLVLKKGKLKWKTKKKKVWKYKTKTKKKKVWKYKYYYDTKFSHYDRDNFIMDLGVF